MPPQKITLKFTTLPDGSVTTLADTEGFVGQLCEKKVVAIMKTLDPNAALTKRQPKKEYYQSATTAVGSSVSR